VGRLLPADREEIEWITQNLFVGNDLWSGKVKSRAGQALDLRNIRSPIVLFASMGDNITPAQQAFNWVADVYGSTDEIKARGQVIVGLLHQSIGHLGIFVSGSVAKKEHAQIVSVLKSIEALPPGLYGMQITERKGEGGKPEYDVTFHEQSLEGGGEAREPPQPAGRKALRGGRGGVRLQPARIRVVRPAAGAVHVQRLHREARPRAASAAHAALGLLRPESLDGVAALRRAAGARPAPGAGRGLALPGRSKAICPRWSPPRSTTTARCATP